MELSIIVSCLVGLWVNWSFLVQTKHKWETKLYILRQLIVFQVTANSFNLSVHLILLIPWPFWGYAVRPGDYLWTVDPLTCRLITAVLVISCIVCILNAAGIFLSNQGKDELRKERLGNNAAVVVSATCFLSGILTLHNSYTTSETGHFARRKLSYPLVFSALRTDRGESYLFILRGVFFISVYPQFPANKV